MARIAIVGVACTFPGASDADAFWSNTLRGHDAITEVPEERLDLLRFDGAGDGSVRVLPRRGGFIDLDGLVDPIVSGLLTGGTRRPGIEELLALRLGLEALRDAGYGELELPRERTGIVVGRAGGSPAEGGNTAALLARHLGIDGPAHQIDAGGASSLVALEQGSASLVRGELDLVLAGGIQLIDSMQRLVNTGPFPTFSRAGAVRPFSRLADGTLPGEGGGLVVLKRLEDARAVGDRIYAIIEGVGVSGGGAGGSMAARVRGLRSALENAWRAARVDREAIGFLEANGSGDPLEDAAELEALADFFGPATGTVDRPVLGSVRSMVGHTGAAAGIAGVIRAALAIYHGLLPPTLHTEAPHPWLAATRFRVIGRSEEWRLERGERVAAVDTGGFGGPTAHVVLRGDPGGGAPRRLHRVLGVAGEGEELPPGVLLLSAETPAELLARLERGERDLHPGGGRARLAIIAPDERKLALARKAISAGKPWRGRQQIYFSAEGLAVEGGKVAFLFPGLDSRFEPQAADLSRYFGIPLPPNCEPLDPATELLRITDGVIEFNGFLAEILDRLEIRADAVAGHSLGELSALYVAGILPGSLQSAKYLYKLEEPYAFPRHIVFLVVSAGAELVAAELDGLDDVYLSHDNCQHQVIVCGEPEGIEGLSLRLRERGVLTNRLPFVGGFHSPYFEAALGGASRRRTGLPLADPLVPFWSSSTAAPFPEGNAERQELVHSFLVRPVRFRDLVEAMYRAGHRIFLQVGTGSLPGFVADILSGRPHATISVNQAGRSGLAQLANACALLWVEGVSFDTRLLSAGAARIGAQPPIVVDPRGAGVMGRIGERFGDIPPGTGPRPRSSAPEPAGAGAAAAPLQVESGPSPAAALSGLSPDDPVHAAVLRTLAEIDEARAEVLQLLAGQYPGGVHRHVPRAHSNPAPVVGTTAGLDLRVTRLLDPKTTIPFIMDHSLQRQRPGWPVVADWNPVVPMAMEIEMVRRAAESALPGLKVVEVRNAHAYRWLGVAEPVTVVIALRSERDGLVEAEIEGYFRAELHLAPEYPQPPAETFPPLRNPRPAAIDATALYRDGWMFHGPAYQGITRLGERGDDGISADLRVPVGEGALYDNMGQAGGYWLMEEPVGCFGIPIGVERLRFFAPVPEVGAELHCEVRIRELDELNNVTRIRLTDLKGRVLILADGWRSRRYQVDQEFRDQTMQIQNGGISVPLADGVVLFEDRYDTAMVRDYISRLYLTVDELALYQSVPPRRRRGWLNGRCAAKDAVRRYLHARSDERIFPKEMVILNEESGRPVVRPNVTTQVPDGLCISLTHKGGYAAAIASDREVGIDLERIEPRGEEFIALVLSAAEREVLGADEGLDIAVTRAWVAKEAVAKATGSGLGGNPKAWVLEARSGTDLCVNGRWVTTRRVGADHIVGWTIPGPIEGDGDTGRRG